MSVLLNKTRIIPSALFTLTPELMQANLYRDVHATCVARAEMGLLNLPYPRVTIEAPFLAAYYSSYNSTPPREFPREHWGRDWGTLSVCFTTFALEDGKLHVIYEAESVHVWCSDFYWECHMGDDSRATVVAKTYSGTILNIDEDEGDVAALIEGIRNCLVYMPAVLCSALCTRAIREASTTKYNKRADRGIGNGVFRSANNSTIYISATTLRVPERREATGRVMPTHWRRGHVHTFLTGPGRTQKIQKFVEPVEVNAAPEFDAAPKKYMFKKGLPNA